MKWERGRRKRQREARAMERARRYMASRNTWHRWFAWRPITLSVTHDAWLEFVERKARQFDPVRSTVNPVKALVAWYRGWREVVKWEYRPAETKQERNERILRGEFERDGDTVVSVAEPVRQPAGRHLLQMYCIRCNTPLEHGKPCPNQVHHSVTM